MSLPEPEFIARDPQIITSEIVAQYEHLTGKTLYPAQAERILVDIIAYRETLVRAAIQEAAKQNLLAFARAPMLDYLGELVGVTRLPAKQAITTHRFMLETPLATGLLIPVGTRIDGGDGNVTFATDVDVTLVAGQLSVDVASTCEEPGVIGNGWQPGQINNLVDDIGDMAVSVTNITVTSDGIEEEENDALRERIRLAPEAFSTAGSKQAYVFHTKSVHQSIVDVGVIGPELAIVDGQIVSLNGVPAGCVRIYPLTKTGLPSTNLLALVKAALNADRKRPLTDLVEVFAPTPIEYRIDAELELYKNADADSLKAMVQTNAERYQGERAAGLGRDLVPSQLNKSLQINGVYQTKINSPSHRVLAENEWATCSGIHLVVTGVADG